MNKVLIVGGEKVGKKHLVHELFSRGKQQEVVAFEGKSENAASSSRLLTCSRELPISTKYYRASVEFTCYKPPAPFSASTILSEITVHDYQAIVMLFSLHNRESLELAKTFAVLTKELGSSYETALLVANVAPVINLPPEQQNVGKKLDEQPIQSWCVDQGIEYVRVYSAQEQAEQVDQEDHDEGGLLSPERFGFDRVLEALESTMWQNMEQLQKQQQHNLVDRKTQQSLAEGTVEKMANDSTVDADASTSLDQSAERAMEEMDTLLEQMLHLRNTGASLDHAERKEKAAAMAMSLFKMLKLDEEDEEDEEDNNDL